MVFFGGLVLKTIAFKLIKFEVDVVELLRCLNKCDNPIGLLKCTIHN
jgi:hypothetical protein